MQRSRLLCCAILLASAPVLAPRNLVAQNKDSDKAQAGRPHSTITIHVQKSGLFSAFAHNHVITAPVARGTVNADRQRMAAEIVVATRDMKVVDPEVSEKDRAEIQQTMLGPKVLDAAKFTEIRFQTSHVQEISPQHYRVTGKLELHGASQDLTFEATGGPDHYQGKTKLKQTAFGIQPVAIAGGTVKVKDEVEIEFDILAADLVHP